MNDPLHVASSDHPGMALTTIAFNGSNFHGRSRTVKMALGAKLKLGFITAFLYATSAFELWKEINERHGQSNGPLIYHLERELSSISQGSLSIAAYFNKLKKCWDELHNLNDIPSCTCGKMAECTCKLVEKFLAIESRSRLVQFLMKLNNDYESVRNQILAMDPLPNVKKAYCIIQQVEKQKQVTHHVPDPTAFFAKMGNNKGGKKTGKSIHSDFRPEMKQNCTYCGEDGHSFDQCFERIRYPDRYKGKKGKKGKKGGFKMAAQVTTGYEGETPFDLPFENEISAGNAGLDPKLINAMYQEVFKMFKEKSVQDNGTPSTSAGHTCISCYVTSFALTSVGNKTILTIEWIIDTGASNHMTSHFHLFISTRQLKTHILVHLPNSKTIPVYTVGQVKLSESLTLEDVLYVPEFEFSLLSVGKLLVTQGTELWLLEKTKPKFVRSGNGTELVNKEYSAYFKAQGIIHQRSMAYTPQQNGVVERKHRHLIETARAIKMHVDLPIRFWGDCVLVATYLINRMTMQYLSWKTPFEILHGVKPTYEYLRTTGCLCYATNTRPHKDKFGPRGVKCILLGYPPAQRGYRLYNLDTAEVFHSRDVVFEENIFPFKQRKNGHSNFQIVTSISVGNGADDIQDFITQLNSRASNDHSDRQSLHSDNEVIENHFFGNNIPENNTSDSGISPEVISNNREITTQLVGDNIVQTRRSTKNKTTPAWLQDFVVSISKYSNCSTTYPLFTQNDFQRIPHDHVAFLAKVFTRA
uniref:uncharacterized protein LOC122583197 n=1 Tax=Erigeron canadensis TaxID=72917 RepID=UPI001CB8F5F1|nr:uncharacterized protein LOC122583197 [Erigeron canadensis]